VFKSAVASHCEIIAPATLEVEVSVVPSSEIDEIKSPGDVAVGS